MFTGLIETLGSITSITHSGHSITLTIKPESEVFSVPLGGSVAVNGSCLTVTHATQTELRFTAIKETVSRTTLHILKKGDKVNLERAMRLSDRLDGHLVAGHVDGVGTIAHDTQDGSQLLRKIKIDPSLARFCAEKGSICVDGISLTIAQSGPDFFSIAIIPHTLSHTTLAFKKVNDLVNIECDLVARYIFHLIKNATAELKPDNTDTLLMNKLKEYGF